MKNINARFTNGSGAVLTVYTRFGKAGINVAASLKAGAKAVTVEREVIKTDGEPTPANIEDAGVAHDKMVAKAEANGWTRKVRPVAKPRVRKTPPLTGIPAASEVVTPAAEEKPAEAESKPTLVKPASGKSKSRKAS